MRYRCAAQEMERSIPRAPHRLSRQERVEGRYADTSREKFFPNHVISASPSRSWQNTRGEADAGIGGAMITLTLGGSVRVMRITM